MALINENYLKLPGSYLFSEIARRVNTFKNENPDADIIRLGIGDVTKPLPEACIKAMHEAVDEMSNPATFRGYGPEQGYEFLIQKIIECEYTTRNVDIAMDEVFVSDGSKSDVGNIQEIFGTDNIVAIIIIAVAVAVAYVSISSEEGEDKVLVIKKLIEAVKKVIFNILAYVIDLTPYAVLCLTACSASQLLSDKEALVQLVLLVVMVFAACLIQSYVVNAVILKSFAKVNPLKFFKKTFDAQATAFTTTSSVGTMPITIDRLIRKVGVDEEVANFTAPLGTTIGMAGCTCVWPILLAMFYLNATGQSWGVSQYLVMCFMCLVLSLGSAGMPGVGVITAVSLFSAVNLPIAAVVLLIPINNITDMVRTLTNVTDASVCAAVVARQNGLLNDEVFAKEDEKLEKGEA